MEDMRFVCCLLGTFGGGCFLAASLANLSLGRGSLFLLFVGFFMGAVFGGGGIFFTGGGGSKSA